MPPAPTQRLLYVAFVAAVVATLACAGMLVPTQSDAAALSLDIEVSDIEVSDHHVATQAGHERAREVVSKAIESARIKLVPVRHRPTIRVTTAEPTELAAQLPQWLAPQQDASVSDIVVAPRVVVEYDLAPEDDPPSVLALSIDELGEDAVQLVDYDLDSLGYTISFHGPKLSYLGLAHTDRRHIEIFVRPTLSVEDLAFVIGHEVGHAVDHIHNDSDDRDVWRAVRGMDASQPWWPAVGATDWGTPAGDFAECFGWWATGGVSSLAPTNCAGTETLLSELSARATD